MNLQKLAERVCKKEGKKISLPIGQVKEVIRILLDEFAVEDVIDVLRLLKSRRNKLATKCKRHS